MTLVRETAIEQYAISIDDKEFYEVPCIFKHFYSDFIVVEIPKSGTTPLQPRNVLDTSDNQEEEETYNRREEVEFEPPEPKKPKILDNLIQERLNMHLEGSSTEPVSLDVKTLSKEQRKEIYMYLRATYGTKLTTQCKNGEMKLMRASGTERPVRAEWPKDRGNFLHFTLTKINMETFHALKTVSKRAGLSAKIFSTAGTKDKRGITSQKISAYRVEKSKLLQSSKSLRNVWLSDFAYNDDQIRLGDLNGNWFSVILRGISKDISDEGFTLRVNKWKEIGFLNYYGFQRFGTHNITTAEIGRQILCGQWEAAVRSILTPWTEADQPLREALELFQSHLDPGAALKKLSYAKHSAHIEHTVLKTLNDGKIDGKLNYRAAVQKLPREIRSLYVHSYQGLIFNRIVSRRVREFGLSILDGDLGCDGKPLSNPRSLELVYLPLPSCSASLVPSNEIGKWYSELLTDDGVSLDAFSRLQKEFLLGDVYRPFIVRPKNVHWEFLEYQDPNEELQKSEFVPQKDAIRRNVNEKLSKDPIAEGEQSKKSGIKQNEGVQKLRALKISFDLPAGSYATMALRELLRYNFSASFQKARETERYNNPEHDNSLNG